MVTIEPRRPSEQCRIHLRITGDVSFVTGDLSTQVNSALRRDRTMNKSDSTVTALLSDREWTRIPTLVLESVREQYVLDLLRSTDRGSVEAEAEAQTRLSGQAFARSVSGGAAQVGLELHLAETQNAVPDKVLASTQDTGINPLGTQSRSDTEYILFPEHTDQNTFDVDSYKKMMQNLRERLDLSDTRLVCRTV